MIEGSLSRRYARALFRLALAEGREEEIGQEMGRFASACADSSLAEALNNPAFDVPSRKSVLVSVGQALELSSLMLRFLSLLLERRRLTLLPAVFSCYRSLLDEAKGRVEARVVAAAPLEEGALQRLRAALGKISGKEVILKDEIDPGLIGGAVIHLQGKIYDGSVRTQLEKMRQRIERG